MSPQQTDPLSWFTKPLIPTVLTSTLLVYGAVAIVLTWNLLANPLLEMLALALQVLACVLVQRATRPLRTPFGLRQAVLPLLLTLVSVLVSAVGNHDSILLVQHWWVPVGVGLVLGSMSPYSSVRQLIGYGAIFTAAATMGAWYGFIASARVWPPLSAMLIAASGVVIATAACAIFSGVIVKSTQSLLTGAGTPQPVTEAANEEAARQVERRTLARLGTRVAPFLRDVADRGTVTEEDRALAGQLARQLRADLVSQANRSWLDSLALYGPIYVVDPDHRADAMNTVQRAALRGLLLAVMKNPATRDGSLFIELRSQDDGGTAVALSLDLDLPEGRRTMMLAPYYLTLQTAVQELSWDPARELLKFQFPAQRP
ncbi:hypothetical protein EYE40_08235 [Glaciihabitans arcticus]|uniref:Uncharacterized protein n=1 Tax=Glaciihabitans arcticus TaxID=2668039 RepID=A0A4Q9GW11_9MICO|nr:hypothetical protein [Glaciihabitans arcticus]TBN57387.1 hypothetical protein EYE40_08235 [Glaciihabitans arcticus]